MGVKKHTGFKTFKVMKIYSQKPGEFVQVNHKEGKNAYAKNIQSAQT